MLAYGCICTHRAQRRESSGHSSIDIHRWTIPLSGRILERFVLPPGQLPFPRPGSAPRSAAAATKRRRPSAAKTRWVHQTPWSTAMGKPCQAMSSHVGKPWHNSWSSHCSLMPWGTRQKFPLCTKLFCFHLDTLEAKIQFKQYCLQACMWTGNMAAVETSEGTADGTCARRRLNRALWVEEMALWDIIWTVHTICRSCGIQSKGQFNQLMCRTCKWHCHLSSKVDWPLPEIVPSPCLDSLSNK